jgi:hypothetical protein
VGNLYPVSSFDMYAGDRLASNSRIVARDAAGAVREVRNYEAFDCDGDRVPIGPDACPADWPYDYISYLDHEAADWIATHRLPLTGGESVDIVRRIWRLSPEPGPPPSKDCLLLRCRVRQ